MSKSVHLFCRYFFVFLLPLIVSVLGVVGCHYGRSLGHSLVHERSFVFIDGLKITWKADELSKWLDSYSSLDRLCIVQPEMNCGALGRTTKLTELTAVTTTTGVCWALRKMDGGLWSWYGCT